MQRREGRYFVHEHPQSACSWNETSIQKMSESDLVLKAQACMCAFGMVSRDELGEGPVKKPTTCMTNIVELYKILSRPCPGCVRHVNLVSGRAAAAQVYPKALCRAMCQGIVRQAQADAQELMSLECTGDVENNNVEHEQIDMREYWDDLSGRQLDKNLTQEARAEEIREVHRMGVYVKVSLDECLRETGKMPVGTRWVDVNKGDTLNPKVRSRLVAQEIAVSKQPELFAATPPIEYIRYLVSCVASSQWGPRPTRLMVQDVKKAYFYAPATRRIYVKIPDEDRGPGEERMCGLLKKSLYGTRDAAHNWASAYTAVLERVGFEKGITSPCSFWHMTACHCGFSSETAEVGLARVSHSIAATGGGSVFENERVACD